MEWRQSRHWTTTPNVDHNRPYKSTGVDRTRGRVAYLRIYWKTLRVPGRTETPCDPESEGFLWVNKVNEAGLYSRNVSFSLYQLHSPYSRGRVTPTISWDGSTLFLNPSRLKYTTKRVNESQISPLPNTRIIYMDLETTKWTLEIASEGFCKHINLSLYTQKFLH